MPGIIVDSNIILDLFLEDPVWADWSESQLNKLGTEDNLYINQIIYSEVSIGFKRIEELEKAVSGCGFRILQIPKEALFLAGKVFIQYRKRNGKKLYPLPDFFIGAHAAVSKFSLLTRDIKKYRYYFPTVRLIHP
ncbi:MAG: type II toxin-antitoxin system VapC family toxin [bacterium]